MRSLLLVLLFPLTLFAQFDVPDDLKKATVAIEAAGCCGSGAVIKIGDKKYVLTAAHVTNETEERDITDRVRPNINVLFHDLIPVTMTVKEFSAIDDLAILEGSVPDDVPFIEISENPAVFRDEVRLLVRSGAGLLQSDIQMRKGVVAPNSNASEIVIGNYIGMADPAYNECLDCWIQPGDSGSPLLDKDNKIVGVLVRGGGPHFDSTNGRGEKGRALWPSYAIGLKPLKVLIAKVLAKEKDATEEKVGFLPYADFVQAQKQKTGTYYILVSAVWCGPCQTLKARLQKEIRTPVYILDYDASPEAAKKFLKGRGLPGLFRVSIGSPNIINKIETYGNGNLKEFFGEN